MKIQLIPIMGHNWDRIIVTLQQIYPNITNFAGKHGTFGSTLPKKKSLYV
jgi:hypothetical protein